MNLFGLIYYFATYNIGSNPSIETKLEFWDFCAAKLKEFDQNLEIPSSEVAFTSFYYKMLKWLDYHLVYQIRNIEVGVVADAIINNPKISKDIRAAFDEKIYIIKDSGKLASFGKETDFAIQLINDIENVEKTYLNGPEFQSLDGKRIFLNIITPHRIECEKVEVYEKFVMSTQVPSRTTNYHFKTRELNLFGLVDVTLNYRKGIYISEFDYNSIDLKKYERGTIIHFKHVALLFMKAVESFVFHTSKDLYNNREYMFQKAFIENFSTRNEAFDLRVCSLNLQVQIMVTVFYKLYSTNNEQTKDPQISAIVYRLLQWLRMYSRFRACNYTDDEITNIFSIYLIPSIDTRISNTVVPRGIFTLEKLKEFATEGNTNKSMEKMI